ncbi:MAG TPA: 2Fe-2S iron-sulfur cluster binding domain-containing protein [Novosphingobium sp.]|nr:2Fe-2S iron-sulfur cluster binding domain-containing protein [Novosphingobium sp.]
MLKKLFSRKPPRTVELLPSGERFAVGRNQTVLECALAAGIAYPHDCTVGTCGQCRSRLVEGKVDAITPFGYTLSREELAAGYILACQAVPESDMKLEVDTGSEAEPAFSQPARLIESRDLTHDIKAVSWEVAQPVRFRAGQYMNISWPGAPGPRSYSFSTAPGPDGLTRLTAFIRKVPGGAFTERLFGEDLGGVDFGIEAPLGNFWLRDGEGPILLIGGGSGLAPLMSLLEDAAARGVRRDAILLFGGRAERDLYCLDEIAAIGARWQAAFDFRPVLSEEAAAGRRFGMVTQEIPAAIADLGNPAGLQAYLCGPPAMIDAALATLATAGVHLADIHYDKFTDASSQAT